MQPQPNDIVHVAESHDEVPGLVIEITTKNRFTLLQGFVEQYKTLTPDWGPLGEVTYRRTYSRRKIDGTYEQWWETVQRVVEGVFSYQKWHIKRQGLSWSEKKSQRSAQIMYKLIFDMKFLPPGRGLWMAGTEYVERFGGAALNNCFASETEIITSEGIKEIGPLAGTIQTLLTKGGLWVKAPIKSFGKQVLYKMTMARQGIEKIVYVTGNHRWFASDKRKAYRDEGFQEFKTTELLAGIHRLQYVFGQGIKGNIWPSPFAIAHGFTFGDGRTVPGDRNSNAAILIGDKDAVLKPYFAMCPKTEKPDIDGLEVRALPNFFREKPSIKENKSYLLGWLVGYFAADGTVTSNGQVSISSSIRSNLEFVRDVCSIIGIGYYSIQKETRESNLTHRPHTMYRLSLMRDTLDEDFFLGDTHKTNFINNGGEEVERRYWTVTDIQVTKRIEDVYCAVVESKHAFALEGNILTGNCAFVSTANINDDFSSPFCFLMDMSMLGVGVGGDCVGAGTVVIQKPTMTDDIFTVADSREGWVALLRRILDAYTGKGMLPKFIDYSLVRPAGAPIKTFGGVSAGPEPLAKLIKGITETLDPLTGKLITSEAIVDLFDKVGVCVVSGNVRRSAIIMLGDPEDEEYAKLKDPDLNAEAMMSHRWASNNSIVAKVGMDYTKPAASTAKNGEPGYFWIESARAFGRMADPPTWADQDIVGTNPCSEQSLGHMELCCLVETFPSRHASYDDYKKTLKYAYLYAKSITLVPTHDPRVNSVILRNRRIGCSQSGIIDSFARHGRRAHLQWCDDGYKYLRQLDGVYSDWFGIPRSRKITSVKPSGTVSLLPGVSPGIHYPHAEYYYRTMRIARSSPLVVSLRNAGYHIEDDVVDQNSSVVYFPIHEGNFDRAKDQVSMWEQLENAAQMQHYWADNQVSITVTFKPEEAASIKPALELYESRLKSISFLPLTEHKYVQAPYQTITKEQYEYAMSKIKAVDFSNIGHESDDKFCDGDKCVIP